MIGKQQFTQEAMALLPALTRIALGILRNGADAQDAVQQSLLKAWEKRDQAREDSFRGWLTRIVINQCRDMLRGKKKWVPMETLPDRPVEERDYDPPDPVLAGALAGLKESLRVPLLLRYMEGYSNQEIAGILNLPATLVKNRLFRARRALQNSMTTLREEER